MQTVKIAQNSDPFKKYWWVILLGFGVVGGWICMPMMDSSVGSGSVSTEGGLKSAEQSLDSLQNSHGAPGSAVDLSMEGSYRKKAEGPAMSSLYQAPEEPEQAVAAGPTAAPGTLADALKDISKKTTAAGSVDGTGGWGEKAQRGFSAPKASFGAMSGFSGSSGSGAAASGGGSGGGTATFTGFGAQKANTGVAFAKGLREGSEIDPTAKSKTFSALQGAQSASLAAARQGSNDAAAAMGGGSFDGTGGGGSIKGGSNAASIGGGAGVYGKMDGAPINLKANDPNLNQMKIEPPPAVAKEEKKDPNDEMREMIMQMIIMAVVGGLVNGVVGGVLGSAGLGGKAKGDASLSPLRGAALQASVLRRPYGIIQAA